MWNRIPDDVRSRVVTLALDEPELSPRELVVRFTDAERYFVSEASVYRLLKAHDLITSPAFTVRPSSVLRWIQSQASAFERRPRRRHPDRRAPASHLEGFEPAASRYRPRSTASWVYLTPSISRRNRSRSRGSRMT